MLEKVQWKYSWFEICGFSPHPDQGKILDSPARFRVIIAGRRWGKSLFASKEAGAELGKPNRRGWIVAPTHDLTKKVFREVWNDIVIKQCIDSRFIKRKSDRDGDRGIWMTYNTSLECKSAENPDSLIGEGLDFLIIDEPAKIKQELWEKYLRPTLADRQGWAMFITTPEGFNWIYDLYERGQDVSHPEWFSLQSPSWNNPFLKQEEIDEAKRTTHPSFFAQEWGASFEAFTGLVFKQFDRKYHVIKPFVIPDNWVIVRGIDPGFTNPFACVWVAFTKDGDAVVFDEHYMAERLISEHAEIIKQKSGDRKIFFTVADPSNAQVLQELCANGIFASNFEGETDLKRRINDVRAGLNRVSEFLYIREKLLHPYAESLQGAPKLYVFETCTNTIKEFYRYRWKDSPDSRNSSEEPHKEFDHLMDALRYVLMAKVPYSGEREKKAVKTLDERMWDRLHRRRNIHPVLGRWF